MNIDDFLMGCNALKIYPQKYDADGWQKIIDFFSVLSPDVKADLSQLVSKLPANKKSMDVSVCDIKERMAKPTYGNMLVNLDADRYVTLPEDKKAKELKMYINKVELDFPPMVLELDPAVQRYISANFVYTYSDAGEPIVYCRDLDSEGTVWDEVADSVHTFEKLKGKLRKGMQDNLVIRSLARSVTVYISEGEGNKVFENIPYWKLHRKYFDRSIITIHGKPENVEIVKNDYNAWINRLKRCHEGKLQHNELAAGMQKIPEMLKELDDSINQLTFFYRKKIDFPTLTNDPDEPARAYFDLNTIKEGPTPDFDGFLEAIHPACRDALMAAIYATFFAKCKLNQYIWIHGEGGDGKSSLLNALSRYAGDHLACSLSAQDMKSEFGLENAVGKRVVIMSDVKTGLTVKSGLIHNLTGHDLVSINRKNRPIISVRLNPIVWIAANDAPDVNFDNRNEARRCLYIKMVEPPLEIKKKFYFVKPDGTIEVDDEGQPQNNGYDLEGHIVAEMPHILYKCRQAFERVCPAPYSVIKQNSQALHIAKENCLDIDAATFNTYIIETFAFNNGETKMLQTEIFEAMAETMRNHNDRSGLNQFAKRDIRRLLTVKYGCQRKKIDGIYYMTGIARKLDGMSPVTNPATGRPVYVPDQPLQMPEQPSVGDFV